MKNKSGIFSSGLYLEGIRQSRFVGLPFICLVLLCEAYCWIQRLFNGNNNSPEVTLIMSYISFCVAAPICVLSLFHFLNSRAGSDFYHSIPQKRTALYTSFAASALTWSAGGTLISAVSETLMGLTGAAQDAYGSVIARALIYAVVCGLLVVGACLLGMTVSGNLISQLATTGLILFLPRALLTLASSTVCSQVPTLPEISDHLGNFFSYRTNLLFESLFDGLFGASGSMHITWQSIIYTVVLGAAYFLLGMKLFRDRKSEKASYPAVSKYVQSAVRVLVAFIVCLFADNEMINHFATNRRNYIDPASMALAFGLAVITYFVYEIISSRSIRGLRSSWKELLIGLAVLAGLNIAYIGGTLGMINTARSYVPDADKVKSISLAYDDDGYYTPTYFELLASDIDLDDPETINTALDALRHDNQSMKDGSGIPDNRYTVCFNLDNGSVKRRNVGFTLSEYQKFNSKLLENRQFADALAELPGGDTITSVYASPLSSSEARAVWDQLAQELGGLSDEELSYINNRSSGFGDMEIKKEQSATYGYSYGAEAASTYRIGDIVLYGKHNGTVYSEDYRITPLTPKTAELYMELVNRSSHTDKPLTVPEFRDFLKNCGKYDHYEVNLTVDGGNLFDSNGNYVYTNTQSYQLYKWDGDSAPEEYKDAGLYNGGLERILDELERNYTEKPDVSKPFYRVELHIGCGAGDEYSNRDRTMFVNADPVDPMIKEWVMYTPDYAGTEETDTVSGTDAD